MSSDLNSSADDLESDFKRSPKYNVLSRPKRKIHSEIIVNNLDALHGSSESEDEDFVPSDDESMSSDQEIDGHNKNIVDMSLESTERKNSENDENFTRATTGSSSYLACGISKKDKSGPHKKELRGCTSKPKSSTIKTDKTNEIKKKKRKYKKQKVFGNPNSDEETEKFIKNFKNSKIKMVRKKKTIKSKEESANNIASLNKANKTTGPHVKCQLIKTESTSFKIYEVYQSHNEIIETNVQKLGVREKIPPIINQKSPWTCALCHNQSKFINGIGCLFGPYRLSTNPDDDDLSIEYKPLNQHQAEIETNFKEVWLHEGCVVWTPNIYFKNNRFEGIAGALEASSNLKCKLCKKSGATLLCNSHGCKKSYHFPCALQAESFFNKENFTIYCKKHSTHQVASSKI